MDNKEFSKKLEERTKTFAIRIIKLSIIIDFHGKQPPVF